MVDYARIVVLVSVVVILLTMGHQIANVFSDVVLALGVSGAKTTVQAAGPCERLTLLAAPVRA